ncbi:MAG: hypothetical protein V1848_02975 [Candidatus Magasanikbacteria bacterium]
MKTEFFVEELLVWYKKNARKGLPWRKNKITAYEVWVSEIMLQQTQVSRVIDYYQRFLLRFPDIFELAKVQWEDFFPYYQGLGYYGRGKNMLETAKVIVQKYNGDFPRKKEELLQLPGIGKYTAEAILSFAYNKDEIAFDTNVKKILGRFFLGSKFEQINEDFFREHIGGKKKILNAAIMDFSNGVCLRKPKCLECPLKNYCEYFVQGGKGESSFVEKKDIFHVRQAQIYLFLHENHKKYFGEKKGDFSPFLLPKEKNTREEIKKYFLEKYSLQISVRPPHKKLYIHKIPTLFVNAQIQTGKSQFFVFKKEDILSFVKKVTKR